jgi:hypothetical protein
MAFVYHRVPTHMADEILYPLNDLRAEAPEAYEAERAKYVGREAVLEACITEGGLLFLDTVHCAPVHPHHIFKARREAGIAPPAAAQPARFFVIPLERILRHRVLWYRWITPWVNGYPEENVALTPPLDEFEPFDPERYEEFPNVPDRHRSYLRKMASANKPALTFVHIPHVLVAGPVDTSGLRVIQAQDPP